MEPFEFLVEQAKGAKAPVFALDATDAFATVMLRAYAQMCEEYGLLDTADEARKMMNKIRAWQVANRSLTHLPNYKHEAE